MQASTYMTADHGENFQLQTFFMVLLRMFYYGRPITFDVQTRVHIDNWRTNIFIKHLGIVNVISDDIELSCHDRDGEEGTKHKHYCT